MTKPPILDWKLILWPSWLTLIFVLFFISIEVLLVYLVSFLELLKTMRSLPLDSSFISVRHHSVKVNFSGLNCAFASGLTLHLLGSTIFRWILSSCVVSIDPRFRHHKHILFYAWLPCFHLGHHVFTYLAPAIVWSFFLAALGDPCSCRGHRRASCYHTNLLQGRHPTSVEAVSLH